MRKGRWQVIIGGGSPAGRGAAIAAADAGAHLLLGERYGFLRRAAAEGGVR